MSGVNEEEVLDYEEEETVATNGAGGEESKLEKKGHYVGIHASGFQDLLLKPELMRAIVDCGFEHPSQGETLLHNLQWLPARESGPSRAAA